MKNLFFLAQPAQTKQPIFGRHQLSFKLIPTPPLRPILEIELHLKILVYDET